MPTFKNTHNKFHKDKNGKAFWESRSVAVEVNLIAIVDKKIFVLTEKRSATMMDSPNLWAIPSGYMDYDESGWEAAVREVYEETGLYIPDYEKSLVCDNNKKPFEVITDPKHNRQNIVLEYCVVLNFDKSKQKFPIELEQYKNKEIAQIKWMCPSDTYLYEWAFNHDERIENAINVFYKFIHPSFFRKIWNFFVSLF